MKKLLIVVLVSLFMFSALYADQISDLKAKVEKLENDFNAYRIYNDKLHMFHKSLFGIELNRANRLIAYNNYQNTKDKRWLKISKIYEKRNTELGRVFKKMFDMVNDDTKTKKDMMDLYDSYIKKNPPLNWNELIKKYKLREDQIRSIDEERIIPFK